MRIEGVNQCSVKPKSIGRRKIKQKHAKKQKGKIVKKR